MDRMAATAEIYRQQAPSLPESIFQTRSKEEMGEKAVQMFAAA